METTFNFAKKYMTAYNDLSSALFSLEEKILYAILLKKSIPAADLLAMIKETREVQKRIADNL